MRFGSIIKVALRALMRNTMRSILTALGIIIGVGAVIAMVSIGNGAKAQVEAQVASLGQNVITVFSGSMSSGGMRGGWGSSPSLTIEDAEAIEREVSGISGVSPEVRDHNQVLANGLNWNTSVNGESPDYPEIRSWKMASGAMFSDQDVRSVAKVAVIGKTVADQLFPNSEPVGQTLRIRNIPFKILGVLDSKGFNLFGQDQDDAVLVPYTSHMKRLSRRSFISSILIQASSADVIEKVQKDITEVLTQRRKGREPDFTVRNLAAIAATAAQA
ncbi:MAG: ABC transporter permease, partial [Opitutaceae bacterium]